MPSLQAHIRAIGAQIVTCNRDCEGTVIDRPRGVIPRGLILEERSPEASGVIILGMNPGQGDEAERAAFRRDPSYQATVEFMQTHRLPTHQYYRRLRTFVDGCGIPGHILWTELAKCQSAAEFHGPLPLETYRTCTSAFLRQEVDMVSSSWPILAVGRDAYRAAALLFSERAVVGIVHPTGSWGKWHTMFSHDALRPEVRGAVEQVTADRRAAWLADELLSGRANVR